MRHRILGAISHDRSGQDHDHVPPGGRYIDDLMIALNESVKPSYPVADDINEDNRNAQQHARSSVSTLMPAGRCLVRRLPGPRPGVPLGAGGLPRGACVLCRIEERLLRGHDRRVALPDILRAEVLHLPSGLLAGLLAALPDGVRSSPPTAARARVSAPRLPAPSGGQTSPHPGSLKLEAGMFAFSAQRKAVGIDVQMLVDERKQVRALLLDPVKRRGLARPFRSGRECRMFVSPAVSS